ncbi:MAG: multiphosphoryl transfer protein [Thermoleophilaceae bacterium]|nr:multiphosphoryl transfer protein [Thermoleophilaceae bacterium]
MTEQILRGLPASPGLAAGPARVLDVARADVNGQVPEERREAEAGRAQAALDAAAEEIREIAAELAAAGSAGEAEIIETGVLMAADPGLTDAVRAAVMVDGLPAAGAIVKSTGEYADMLASLDDETLSLRADDVRSLGRRAARNADGESTRVPGGIGGDFVLVARELGPADVAELGASARGVALAAGGVMAHAAIVARSLGIPMVVGLGEAVLAVEPGSPLVVDGGDGSVALAPGRDRRHRAQVEAARRLRARERSAASRALAAETTDGHRIRVLVNVASTTEVGVGLGAGADGIGLFRTELRFLDARKWPSEEDHRRHLASVLASLAGMTATVRLLDFGGDKTPPFLDGTDERGIGLLLAHPEALAAQLRAIVAVGAHTELRILMPMVESAAQVEAVRAVLSTIDGGSSAQLGAMVETVTAVDRAGEIAAVADFLSIGTNDLTHSALRTNRFAPGQAFTHHPVVLRAIAATITAAVANDRLIEVCGEAGGDSVCMPLLLGLGVNELSTGAALVGTVRAWTRALEFAAVAELAQRALALESAFEVAELMRPTAELVGKLDNASGESVEGGAGVVAIGGQP